MIIQGSAPIPNSLRWKEGETLIAINQRDNGDRGEEFEGTRYEADFTIVKDTDDITGAIEAFTRMTTDPVQDQLVVDNIEIDGTLAIDIKKDYPTKVSSTIFPPLPNNGWLEQGVIYSYNNGAVMVRQPHERTIYPPEQTPALFSFWRDNTSAELAWMDGENVEEGWKRIFGGKTYECLRTHQTQSDWTPTATLGVMWKELPSEVISVWKQPTGAHDAYRIGAKVHFPTINDPVYESLIDYNTYSPTAYPAGWRKL